MNIEERFLTINPYSRSGEKQGKIKKIVTHWVGNANTSAMANRNYFNNLKDTHETYASSQYIIGLVGEIIYCVPEDEVAFHSGDRTMNRCSIGIENCHPDWNGKFNDKTYNSLLELCAELCKKYGLTENDVIRHYDVTKKCCPKYYVEHNEAWQQFKNDLKAKLQGGSSNVPTFNCLAVLKSKTYAPLRKSKSHTENNVITHLAPGTPVELKARDGQWGIIPQGYINLDDFEFAVMKTIITAKNGVPLRSSASHSENNVITYLSENTPLDVVEALNNSDFIRCPQGYINRYDCKE